jgi:RNA polymerase sigma-70 factor, ECF subfamily
LVNLELVERARTGDRDAFDALAAGKVDRLYAIATLILRDGDRAEDAVQETLVRCWRDLHALRDAARFDAWLHRLLFRAINDEFRTGHRHEAKIRVLRLEPSTADESGSVAVREQLDHGFQRLSPEHRAVIVLRLYLGLSVEETAAAIGIRPGTAKSRLHYAVESMRNAIEAEGRPSVEEATA